jgi:mannose-6-phosphate isomerase-like protein (cupin superfamily)
MQTKRKLLRVMCGLIAAFGLVWCTDREAVATAPSGVTFTVLSRATVPEFDARRKFREERSDTNQHESRTWKIELEATRMIDVVTVLFTVQPGGHSGWHTHPGPALFTVSAGTLTMYDGDDPSCTPHQFANGTGSIEAGTDDHIHILRNETTSAAQTIVTFLVPVGAAIRSDLPDPGHCAF